MLGTLRTMAGGAVPQVGYIACLCPCVSAWEWFLPANSGLFGQERAVVGGGKVSFFMHPWGGMRKIRLEDVLSNCRAPNNRHGQ